MKQEVITFGCRLNSFESEVIKNNLTEAGLNNVAVFNTCAVTKEAERQARQAIRKYRRENPDAKIIVTGCGAQINPKTYGGMEAVDMVIGNQEKLSAETYKKLQDSEKILVNDIMSIEETAGHLVTGIENRSRAFLQVQNGCNHRCTFCIIPYGRGNSRSVSISEITAQVKILVANGYNEVVLTGVDITDYGLDLPEKPTLGGMIKELFDKVPGINRLRLSSIDVAEIDSDLLDLLKNEPRFMPHLHLSLQAGDDMILKRMKRRHTRGQVLDFVKLAKSLRPDVVFGADIIAGFPTESDEMFENSLKIISEAGLIHLHVFPYSEREGTPAALIPAEKQVLKNIRKERAARLREAGKNELQKFLNSRIGKTERIVVEKPGLGHSEHFAMVKFSGEAKIGDIVEVVIDSVEGENLVGRIGAGNLAEQAA